MLLSKNSPCIWATFDRNHVTENFQKSLNLVTLVGPLEEEFLSNQQRDDTLRQKEVNYEAGFRKLFFLLYHLVSIE